MAEPDFNPANVVPGTFDGTSALPNYLTGREVGEWTGLYDKGTHLQNAAACLQ